MSRKGPRIPLPAAAFDAPRPGHPPGVSDALPPAQAPACPILAPVHSPPPDRRTEDIEPAQRRVTSPLAELTSDGLRLPCVSRGGPGSEPAAGIEPGSFICYFYCQTCGRRFEGDPFESPRLCAEHTKAKINLDCPQGVK
jgi:hypothetical protein